MKLGIFQSAGNFMDAQRNLDLIERVARSASQQDAHFLIFPELFLSGYNIGGDAARLAEPADGPSSERAAAIAAEHHIALLYGYTESGDGALYNSAMLIDAQGTRLANYRKTHLFGDEERRLFHPGDELVIASIAGIKVGILICYDIEFPELVRSIVLQGAELIAVPTALSAPYYEIPTTVVRARAYENQVFVAYVDRVGVERGLSFIGSSAVVGPDGHDLVRAGESEEILMVSTIDPAAYEESRRLNTYTADRRPELYRRVTSAD